MWKQMWKQTNLVVKILVALAILFALAAGLSFIPRIHEALSWRFDNFRLSVIYFFNPPQKVAFHPSEQSLPTPTLGPATLQPPTDTPLPADLATPTATSTPLPSSTVLANVTYVDQMNRYNYCGPANLAMALEYWGYKGAPGATTELRDQIASVVKPGEADPTKNFIDRGNTDVNVMPTELVDYVNNYTTLKALYAFGGTPDLLKRLIAAGFPAITEKGIYEPLLPDNSVQWAGHYSFTTGYDDSQQVFIWQDSYLPLPKSVGKNTKTPYLEYINNWRAFDYLFIVVYPPDREQDLFQVLGPYANLGWSAQHALDISNQEISSLTLGGNDLYFAMFNKVTSLVNLDNPDYGRAATAYDQATAYYNNTLLVADDKPIPYRIMWYQTAPYKAYYYSGRYQDVINLANVNLQTIEKGGRELEESWYWKSRAEYALSEFGNAYTSMRRALYYHPNFQPALDMFSLWGVTP